MGINRVRNAITYGQRKRERSTQTLRLALKRLKQVFLLLLLLPVLTTHVNAAETVTYYHNDALGSPIAATDEQGNVLWTEGYRPYGERIENNPVAIENDRWFTNHLQDDDTGLVYAGARFYHPLVGRFLSIDPIGVQEGNPYSFNRYAYANNNPYRYVDPDGEFAVTATILIVGAAWTAYDTYTAYQEGGAGAAAKTLAVDGALTLAGGGLAKLGGLAAKKVGGALGKVARGGTYKLKDANGAVKRTGKSNNLDRRRSEHARNSETKDLEFEVDRRTDCCNAQRGREQIIYDQHPEAQSINGGLNKRRPVSPTNPKRDIYRKAGEKL